MVWTPPETMCGIIERWIVRNTVIWAIELIGSRDWLGRVFCFVNKKEAEKLC
jgi:hypothetical protein